MQTTQSSDTKRNIRFNSWFSTGRAWPWLVLLTFLTGTFLLWSGVGTNIESEMQRSFDFRVNETILRIEQRMVAYKQVLRGAQGLFASNGFVGRDQFRTYYRSLQLDKNYPGIQGVGFSLVVKPEEMERHLRTVHREVDPSYRIKPEGKRAMYTTIIYLEPFSNRNLRAFGYDMYSEPVRHEAMAHAADSALPAISGKVKLVQETDEEVQAGFLMYLPIYRTPGSVPPASERRAQLLGWVYSPFRMNDLMDGLFSENAPEADIEIFDGDSVRSAALMYDSERGRPAHAASRFQNTKRVTIAGRTWTVVIRSTPQFEAGFDTNRPMIIVVVGTGISILLSLLVMLLINSRARALEALRVESRYKNLMLQASDSILVIDMNRRITDANQQACDHFGYTLEELRGKKIEELHPPESKSMILRQFDSLKKTGSARFEEINRRKDGAIVPAEISERIVRVGEEEYVLKFVRDISERKRAEHEREQLVDELQTALADIKTLSGLIPICSSCKKIRDDKGYWNVLETYLAKHSEAQFTHGICPDCVKKLYPDYAAKREEEM